MTMASQHDSFHSRLDRINRGKTSAWTIPGEGIAKPGQEHRIAALNVQRRAVARKSPLGRAPLIMLPLALILGVAAVLLGEWLTLTYLTADGPLGLDPVEMFGPEFGRYAAAALVAALACIGLHLGGARFWAHLAGFGFAVLYMPEIVQFAPDPFAEVFPRGWMSAMLSAPNAFGL
ncbi:MAG: hypothetical protein HLUCCA08_17610 [Rhodobacteraceae bacterium HLUCCA08]|nr:MAG: hypothetical protein HLUCCA08_17610 [Rhodobacteraceae bacterium HLUCCA08]